MELIKQSSLFPIDSQSTSYEGDMLALSLIATTSGVIDFVDTWIIDNNDKNCKGVDAAERMLLGIARSWAMARSLDGETFDDAYDPEAILDQGRYQYGKREVMLIWSQRTFMPDNKRQQA